jgi:uncharacterized protein (DUF697 family)
MLPIDADTATPIQIVGLMTEIWGEDPANLYDEWHNARKVMKELGAVQVGNTAARGGEAWITYRLPAGGKVRVQVNGGGIRMPKWGTLL